MCYLLVSSYTTETLGTHTVVDPRYIFYLLVSSYSITLELCTLGTYTIVDPRYICYLLVSSYRITLELCTLGTHTVLDPSEESSGLFK